MESSSSGDSTAVVIERVLRRGERLLWSGRPRRGFFLRDQDIALIPFSLMWFGFSVFWEVGVYQSEKSRFLVIWGALFVLFGVYLVAGRFVIDAYVRSRTFYGVTERRIIVVRCSRGLRSTSHMINSLQTVDLVQHRDGTATLRLNREPLEPLSRRRAEGTWKGTSDFELQRIMEGRVVHDLILEMAGRKAT